LTQAYNISHQHVTGERERQRDRRKKRKREARKEGRKEGKKKGRVHITSTFLSLTQATELLLLLSSCF
jgi:flagellar biosynthesis/type III secretory pathway protein FliH